MIKKNFHTHTNYCDGDNSPREMVEAAISKGFTALGFSGHSHTAFDERYCMSVEGTRAYKREIEQLKGAYSGKIDIYAGIEYDYYADAELEGWDYIIGSVHYVKAGDEYITVDEGAEITLKGVEEHFGGDIYAFCEEYFRTVGDLVRKTNCDIIGHFDVITKFNETVERDSDGNVRSLGRGVMIDEREPRYVAAYTSALDKILRPEDPKTKIPLIEINTGAISREYRSEPYPSRDILMAVRDRGGRVIISSDTHSVSTIDQGFDLAESLANEMGFSLGE